MRRTMTLSIGAAAILFLYLGTQFPLAEVPLLDDLTFHGVSWGGKLRLMVILLLVFGSLLGHGLGRFPKAQLALAAGASGFIGNLFLSALLWRDEHVGNLAMLGSQALAKGIVWQVGALHLGLGAALCIAYTGVLLAVSSSDPGVKT